MRRRPAGPRCALGAAVLLGVGAGGRAEAARKPTVPAVPSIDEVVAEEGFTPTPSQSEIYAPGAVLVPNDRGSHDVVATSCIAADWSTSVMSESSIATTLAGGVSARIGVARGAASAGVEKRLSFVDPEQRTIVIGDLVPTSECRARVKRAGQMMDLSGAFVVYDVLVAIIKNSVCMKAQADGGIVALGRAEAEAFSECVRESDGQVPLGYKGHPLASVLAMEEDPSRPGVQAITATVAPRSDAYLERLRDEAAAVSSAKAQLEALQEAQAAALDTAEAAIRAEAAAAWPLLQQAHQADPGGSQALLEEFAARYGNATVSATVAGESVQRTVSLPEAQAAIALLGSSGGEGLGGPYAMAPVPAGTHALGCEADNVDCEPDEQRHTVTLTRDVYVGEAEVTQALYRSVMGENPSFYSSCGPTCPVEQVSWYDAVRLANALSEQVGVAPCYTIDGDRVAWPEGPACVGYRLPTEAEWEVAARGGRSTTYAGSSRADGVAWTQANSRSKTHPVGEKRPNDLGLHDMSGNVAEWCWDAYGLYPAKSTDPVGPVDGEQRVVRGASWFHLEGEARVTNRDFLDPSSSGFAVGVRLVRSAPPVP